MATLISLGTRGVNLDAVRYWFDLEGILTLYFSVHDLVQFHGEERLHLLKALTNNSKEY